MLLSISAQKPKSPPPKKATSTAQDDPFSFGSGAMPPAPSAAAPTSSARQQSPSRRASSGKGNTNTDDAWKPFARKWLMVVGGVCAFAIVLAIVGLFFELAGLFAAVVCMLLAVGCVFGGRFWIAIMLGRKSTVEGVLAALIPLVGLVMALHRRGELLKGAVVFGSSMIPCLLGLGCVAVFSPNGGSRSGATRKFDNVMERAQEDLVRLENSLDKSDTATTVNFRVMGLNRDIINFGNGADQALQRWKHYEAGSFQFDQQNRKATLQHYGNDEVTRGYRFYLGGRYRVALSVEP